MGSVGIYKGPLSFFPRFADSISGSRVSIGERLMSDSEPIYCGWWMKFSVCVSERTADVRVTGPSHTFPCKMIAVSFSNRSLGPFSIEESISFHPKLLNLNSEDNALKESGYYVVRSGTRFHVQIILGRSIISIISSNVYSGIYEVIIIGFIISVGIRLNIIAVRTRITDIQ